MRVTVVSQHSGVKNTMDLPVTEAQLKRFVVDGEKVQHVFPHLGPHEREFLLTGITPEEWDDMFPDEDGDDDTD